MKQTFDINLNVKQLVVNILFLNPHVEGLNKIFSRVSRSVNLVYPVEISKKEENI